MSVPSRETRDQLGAIARWLIAWSKRHPELDRDKEVRSVGERFLRKIVEWILNGTHEE